MFVDTNERFKLLILDGTDRARLGLLQRDDRFSGELLSTCVQMLFFGLSVALVEI